MVFCYSTRHRLRQVTSNPGEEQLGRHRKMGSVLSIFFLPQVQCVHSVLCRNIRSMEQTLQPTIQIFSPLTLSLSFSFSLPFMGNQKCCYSRVKTAFQGHKSRQLQTVFLDTSLRHLWECYMLIFLSTSEVLFIVLFLSSIECLNNIS